MRKVILIMISFFFTINLFSQKQEIELDSVVKLKSLCQVWGFLKYYHPQVSKGKFDWDNELIKMIPNVLNSKSKKELNITYKIWIDKLGKIKTKKNKKENKKYFNKNFDLSWIDNDSVFDLEISSVLRDIEKNRNSAGSKYYVEQKSNIGNIIIKNENEYSKINYPNLEYRILNLFRYWNIIEYFSPNKYLISKKWDRVLEEMIPRFIKVSNINNYHLLVLELVASTEDGHARYFTKETNDFFGFYWAPFKHKIINSNIIISEYYNKQFTESSGLAIGDVITEIDGVDVQNVLKDKIKYTCGSNINYRKNSIFFRFI